jgi:ubiquinone/menaquinone biosynthesis C-methylase UbiE
MALLTEELGLGPTSTVVELGAGTGKFTRMLAPAVGRLVATEPVAEMRAQLAAAVETTTLVGATAEAIPLRRGCADLVVAATAFHWFRGPGALAEAHRVLRPAGGLALLWNNPDRSAGWVARIWALVDEHRGSTPGNRDLRWQEAFATTPLFTPLAFRQLSHRVTLSLDALVARVASISFIASLAEPERDAVLDRIRSIAATDHALAGRAEIQLPYLTDVYWCRRRG